MCFRWVNLYRIVTLHKEGNPSWCKCAKVSIIIACQATSTAYCFVTLVTVVTKPISHFPNQINQQVCKKEKNHQNQNVNGNKNNKQRSKQGQCNLPPRPGGKRLLADESNAPHWIWSIPSLVSLSHSFHFSIDFLSLKALFFPFLLHFPFDFLQNDEEDDVHRRCSLF